MKNLLPIFNHKPRSIAIASAAFLVFVSLLVSTSMVHAQNSDFAISVNNNSLCTNPGIAARYVISVSSIGGFAGTVNLASSVDPSVANSPSLSAIPSSVSLTSGQSTSFELVASTTYATPDNVFTITVSGLYGATYHSVSITLTVTSDCSVGATIVSATTHASMGAFLGYGLGIAVLGSALAGTIVLVNRKKQSP